MDPAVVQRTTRPAYASLGGAAGFFTSA